MIWDGRKVGSQQQSIAIIMCVRVCVYVCASRQKHTKIPLPNLAHWLAIFYRASRSPAFSSIFSTRMCVVFCFGRDYIQTNTHIVSRVDMLLRIFIYANVSIYWLWLYRWFTFAWLDNITKPTTQPTKWTRTILCFTDNASKFCKIFTRCGKTSNPHESYERQTLCTICLFKLFRKITHRKLLVHIFAICVMCVCWAHLINSAEN